MTTPLIELREICKAYGGFGTPRWTCCGVSACAFIPVSSLRS